MKEVKKGKMGKYVEGVKRWKRGKEKGRRERKYERW